MRALLNTTNADAPVCIITPTIAWICAVAARTIVITMNSTPKHKFCQITVATVRDSLIRNGNRARSLFISATACWRNLGAFVVYGLCWLLADLLMSIVLSGLLSVLGLGQMSIILIMPAALLFSAAFYTSLRGTVEGCIDFD